MKLLANEEKILSSNGDKVVLTDHRIYMKESDWGNSFTINIFLENISSIEQKYESNIVLLILGIASVLAGVYFANNGNSNALYGGLVIGGIFFAIWWFTRQNRVLISSNGGGKLNFTTEKMSNDSISDFIFSVQSAKQKRMQLLCKI